VLQLISLMLHLDHQSEPGWPTCLHYTLTC